MTPKHVLQRFHEPLCTSAWLPKHMFASRVIHRSSNMMPLCFTWRGGQGHLADVVGDAQLIKQGRQAARAVQAARVELDE